MLFALSYFFSGWWCNDANRLVVIIIDIITFFSFSMQCARLIWIVGKSTATTRESLSATTIHWISRSIIIIKYYRVIVMHVWMQFRYGLQLTLEWAECARVQRFFFLVGINNNSNISLRFLAKVHRPSVLRYIFCDYCWSLLLEMHSWFSMFCKALGFFL